MNRRRLAAAMAALLLPASLSLYSLTSSGAVALADWMPERALDVELPARSTVLAKDGSVLATFFEQDRIPVPLAAVSPAARDAVLAVEDARFYSHGALDPVGLLRAVAANVSAGEVREGASTLTQQYVKQALIHEAADADGRRAATEITLSRKIRELGHALRLEEDLGKDEILERYLNIVYFGGGAWGIEVAAQRYFGISARDLSIPQAALLAGLIKGPVAYDPLVAPAAARERRNVVLDRMLANGTLTQDQAREYRAADLGLAATTRPAAGCAGSPSPFFCDYVLAEVRATPGLGTTPEERVRRLLTGGLTVRTTLDPQVQAAAQRAIGARVASGAEHGAAIVMTEPGTGAVRALALSRDYGKGPGRTEVNWALDAAQGGSTGFQAGSTFKTFVLAAATGTQFDPRMRHDAPAAKQFGDFRRCDGPDRFPAYDVGNYDDRDYGRIDAREATARSVNTWFVGLEERLGLCAAPELAEQMGLRRADGKPLSRVPSFVLGVDEVSPLRMAEAYATLAAGGTHCVSRAIEGVRDASGRELTGFAPDCRSVLSVERAAAVTDLLRGAVDGPNPVRTGAAMTLGSVRAAGKTGTTNGATAVWFAGYTDSLAAAVWAGHPDGTKPLRDIEVAGRRYGQLTGGALPGPIWAEAMAAALGLPLDPAERAALVPPELIAPEPDERDDQRADDERADDEDRDDREDRRRDRDEWAEDEGWDPYAETDEWDYSWPEGF
ncbi:MAG: transglycosylase domain-containing protein [Sporichthyaceae bacterium]